MRLNLASIFKFAFFEKKVEFKDEDMTAINKDYINKTIIWRM